MSTFKILKSLFFVGAMLAPNTRLEAAAVAGAAHPKSILRNPSADATTPERYLSRRVTFCENLRVIELETENENHASITTDSADADEIALQQTARASAADLSATYKDLVNETAIAYSQLAYDDYILEASGTYLDDNALFMHLFKHYRQLDNPALSYNNCLREKLGSYLLRLSDLIADQLEADYLMRLRSVVSDLNTLLTLASSGRPLPETMAHCTPAWRTDVIAANTASVDMLLKLTATITASDAATIPLELFTISYTTIKALATTLPINRHMAEIAALQNTIENRLAELQQLNLFVA